MDDERPAAPRPRRGPRRDPDAHEAVLAATRELVAELGYRGVTMDRIASRAGVARMTVYRWWPNKAAVITEAVADRLAPGPAPDTGDVREDALLWLRSLVSTLTLLGDPSVVTGALTERGEAGRAELRDLLKAHAEPAAQLLRNSVARGGLPQGLPLDAIVDSWIGYVVYRTVFLGQEITGPDLLDLVRLLPPPPGPSAGEAG
ncbi:MULTISPECIES: TetR/AcrR family transcriptional regulator [Streptomyces]|uniref:TetR/AcrR family transcriptional regulator n=2 Tax=Streptomyces mutomycini TaxID=284036 RepID=A0ABW0AY57_9ACTN|nr:MULTISPECIES: TetR/AcrR family transcriptional regulator [unclassified Streptomyces]KPC79393.1 TetR family transcriptional regulator [Streptomyces sp. NRRL S-4]